MYDEKNLEDEIENEIDANEGSTDLHQQKMERLLASIKPGYSISVYRHRPSWCRSFLERIECLENDPIDLEYLAQTWGGHTLRLRLCDKNGTYRGGIDIPMSSYPPKFHGTPMKRGQIEPEDLPKGAQPTQNVIHVPPPQQQSPINNIEMILKLLKETRSEDLKTIRELIDGTNIEPSPVGAGISNLVELAEQMKTLKEVFGQAEQTLAAPDDQTALFSTIGDVVKMLVSNKEAPRPRLVQHPSQNPQQLRSMPVEGQQQISNDREIAKNLEGLDPKAIAEMWFNILNRMDRQKGEQTIKIFMTRLGYEEDLESDQGGDDDGDDQGGVNLHPDTGSDQNTG